MHLDDAPDLDMALTTLGFTFMVLIPWHATIATEKIVATVHLNEWTTSLMFWLIACSPRFAAPHLAACFYSHLLFERLA